MTSISVLASPPLSSSILSIFTIFPARTPSFSILPAFRSVLRVFSTILAVLFSLDPGLLREVVGFDVEGRVVARVFELLRGGVLCQSDFEDGEESFLMDCN